MTRQSGYLSALLLPFLLTSAKPSFPPEASVRVVPGSAKSGNFEVTKGTDKVRVESREIEVEIRLTKETVTWYVSMLYDAKTKLLWWNSDSIAAASARRNLGVPALLPRGSRVCLTDSKFVLFWNGWVAGDSVFIRESSEQFSSFDEGQAHVLEVIKARRGEIEAGQFVHQYKEVKFPGLSKDFLYKKYVANAIGPELRDVTQIGDEWRIVEDGPNGGSATIVLNDKYEVQSVKVQPAH